ncbi:MAG: hypothetical protein IKD45_01260 [Clostridia bacterium]|nr:hypothetical protein [Clostridia bacterium]
MKRINRKAKILSFLVLFTLLFNILASPLGLVAAAAEEMIGSGGTPPPTSVPDSVDTVLKNPHDVNVSVTAFPVLTSGRYSYYVAINDFLTSVKSHPYTVGDVSRYYTASLGVWYDHYGIDTRLETALLESDLPYREERVRMFHPELKITDTGMSIDLNSAYPAHTGKDIGSDYLTDVIELNPDQLYLRAGARLLSGYGYIKSWTKNSRDRLLATIDATKHAANGYLDIPYNLLFEVYEDVDFESLPNYQSNYSTTVMTGMHFALIDDISPSVAESTVRKYDNADGTGDIELSLMMNEGVRFSSMEAKDRLDEIWIEVELYNLRSGKYSPARLHLKELDGKNLVFRGNIGYYNYNDFRVARISKVNIPVGNQKYDYAIIDAADGMYVSSYDVEEYGNSIYKDSDITLPHYNCDSTYTTLICDHAGNPIKTSSITNWTLGDQSYVKNTFEAIRVELYADTAYAKLLSDPDPKLNPSDIFVGPANNLSAFVYLDTTLTPEEASRVSVTFNIKDENGKLLTVYSTSSQSYEIDEVYATGSTKGTLLIFESIDLKEGMVLDLPEGANPAVKIVSMNDDIDGRTAYPNVITPETELYADFTSPEYSVRYVGEGTADKDGGKNYWVSAEISVSDKANYEEISGLVGSTVSVSIGGGVDKDTRIRYILSDTEVLPPEQKLPEAYPSETVISEYGLSTLRFTASDKSAVMNYPILENSAKYYLHIFIEGGELLLEDLLISVNVDDVMGNSADNEIPELIEYVIDEIPPSVRHESITRRSVMNEELGKTVIEVTLGFLASDPSRVEGMQYLIGDDPNAEGAIWRDIIIEPGESATGVARIIYGDDPGEDTLHSDIVFVRAVDTFGNVSSPVARQVLLSTEKPVTNVSYSTDLAKANNSHEITVKGAPADELYGLTAYTRVYVTPMDSPEYSYVTLVATGEEASILGFEGLTWYKVKVGVGDMFTEVYGPETVTENYTLTEQSILYGLLTYYGEVKISFENGYGDMTPATGDYVYSAASAGSFAKDQNYLIACYTSPYFEYRGVHGVDFAEITDRENNVVVANADKGSRAYLFNQTRKGISPMRNTRIHYVISNIMNGEYALTDFDYLNSYAELIWVDTDGSETAVLRTNGLAASADQYFIIGNEHSLGAYLSGAYYLRVTVVSRSGAEDVYESSRLVLDAETADSAGLYSYSRQSVSDINPDYMSNVKWDTFESEDGNPITELGVSVIIDGEQMRSSVFAVYSFGVTGLSLILKSPDSEQTVEGIRIGALEGFKLWNFASEPTKEEIEAADFELTRPKDSSPYFHRINGLDAIYDEDTVPKGAEGLRELYLIKGVNTICYQYKMENGYVSPVKYFTVTVTDYSPELNIAIDGYRISHAASDNPAIINAHSVRFLVESAYSLNGEVDVELWSDYGMTVGRFSAGGEITESFLEDPTPYERSTPVTLTDIGIGEYADFTENSYTASFPKVTSLCTAFFVATDEYGGMTVVAPQLGPQVRYGNSGGVYGYDSYNIDYEGSYFDDPYDLNDGRDTFRYSYNEPQYFGNHILSFDTYLRAKSDGDEIRIKDIMISNSEVKYNLFSIVSNDVSAGYFQSYLAVNGSYSYANANNLTNGALIDVNNSKITFSGGDLTEPVTLPFISEDNTVGYMYTSISAEAGRISVHVANPKKEAGSPESVTRHFVIDGVNRYGDSFILEGDITLYYIDYKVETELTERGAELSLSFESRSHGGTVYTGQYNSASDLAYSVTDYYGNVIDGSYSLDQGYDIGTRITLLTTPERSLGPAIIRIERPGASVKVDVTDYEIMSVSYDDIGAGIMAATVTVTENTRFSYRYYDENGDQQTKYIEIGNLISLKPTVVWDFNENDYTETADGVKFRYGSVTAYLVTPGAELTDAYSGTAPKHTFNPGEPIVYTFKAEDTFATVGNERTSLKKDVTAVLPITLYELPDVTGEGREDTETPNVQVYAYRLDGSYSNETKLSLQLENARGSSALTDRTGYNVHGYVGNRATMTSLLRELGWAPALRFEVEVLDMSRIKLFIKEGIYAEAPDYTTGLSDDIPGVTLNSRLITVTEKAAFTLFAVDSRGNSSAVVFDVTDVGLAPSPRINKVIMTDNLGGSFVRAYITPPEEAEEFEITGSYSELDRVESEGEYAGRIYIDIEDNDSYGIPYRFVFRENTVDGILDLNVSEINLREMSQTGDAVWSDNAVSGRVTSRDVTATVTFSEQIAGVSAETYYDEQKLEFRVSGASLLAVYSENHPEVRLRVSAENGTFVTVTLGAVTNINKNAPEISEVSRVLADNGRSVLITLVSDVRASLDGFAGEEGDDGRYYFERRTTENGTFSYVFGGENGVNTTYSFTVSELVLTELTASFSLRPGGENAVSSVAELDMEIGDIFYVNPLRDATLELIGAPVRVPAGVWTEIVVPEPLGGIRPYLVLTDDYGNTLTQQLERIAVPDTSAPEIIIKHTTYSVRIGSDAETVRAELLANFAAIDDTEGEITYGVSFDTDLTSVGIFAVTYTATDAAGNAATASGRLRVTSLREATVSYGEARVFRDGSLILGEDSELILNIDSSDLYYKVVLAEGINTVAQMKPYGETVKDYSLDESIDLGKLAVGTYTLAIVNQERDFFLIYIAVVDSDE